ncbi:leucine-rich repeat-containing protein 51-like [Gigantopelta aegis]|uniref:leucine-rich repeat-containing protein 51-like n=1 Tax=Gigantopelta aegis TaxID=1735272 RepID=UPI001B88C7AF|nr:leucine-rich repeat-containing protein 51-like [Gigantopelta aegis]
MSASASVVPHHETRFRSKKVKVAIDCKNENPGPLDYSFYKLSNLSDIYDEEPRIVSPRKETTQEKTEKEKSPGRCLRLNNNQLSDLKLLPEIVGNLFENPSSLGWLDLSFNEITTIDPVLAEFENLHILYLHGNGIADLKHVEQLTPLKNLWKLTLHGNPIDSVKGYRFSVLSLLPWLHNLDFSAVTKGDQVTARVLSKMNGPPKKKKKEETDD